MFFQPTRFFSSKYLHAICISDSVQVSTSATLWKINMIKSKTAATQTQQPSFEYTQYSGYFGPTTYKIALEIQNSFLMAWLHGRNENNCWIERIHHWHFVERWPVTLIGNNLKVLNFKSKALIKASICSHVPQPQNQNHQTAEMMIHLLLKH